jgi:hypothetical protein
MFIERVSRRPALRQEGHVILHLISFRQIQTSSIILWATWELRNPGG